jgi:acylphosphatase
MEKAFLAKISGRVTGVGFRWSAIDEASRYPSLKGYVRNAAHGEVEALVQGEESEVGLMLAWLSQGPRHARVDNIVITERPLSNDLGVFTVSH